VTPERWQEIELRISSLSTVNILRIAMTPERWQQIEPLLHGARERPPEERSAYLDAACAGDSSLRQQVESLIEAYEQAGAFIESPAVEVAAKAMAAEGVLAPGQMVTHFRVLSRLGQGGMGVVYLAEDTKLGRRVALKLLHSAFAQDKDRLRRFAHEARATSALNHPNIVTIYEIIESEVGHAIVMELVDGRTLRDLMNEPLSLDSLVNCGRQIAQALAAAHHAGVVHRDIKPENIMVRGDGYVKILDFGLARLSPWKIAAVSQPRLLVETNPSELIGTVAYMSPEQARGDDVDSPTDIFSLGIVFYQLATRRHPFASDSLLSTLEAIKSQRPQPPSVLNPRIPSELQHLIHRMLNKDARLRPAAVHVEEALARLGETTKVAGEKKRRNRWVWRIGAATAIFSLLALVFFYRNQSGQSPAPVLTAVPFTADGGFEGYPSFSPDGTQVAYSWNESEDNEDIYIKRVSGGSLIRLTRDPAADTSPAWSPDGRSIAFLRRSSTDNDQWDLFLTPAASGPERKVQQLRIPASQLLLPRVAWTPDSQHLIFPDAAGFEESTALYLLRFETGEKTRLTAPMAKMYGDSSPALSPDGRQLAFVRYIGGKETQLCLLPLDGRFQPAGDLRQVATEHRWLKDPAWTANGRDLVYFKYLVTPQHFNVPLLPSGQLWRVSISGPSKSPTPLGIVGEIGDSPAISSRGNHLAYRVSSSDYDIWRADISPGGTAVTRRKFIASTRPDLTPEYSPDGKRIVFASARSGANEIWVCERDGSNPTQLTFLKANSMRPSWFPDSRRIVFDSNKESGLDVYVIDSSGGSPRRLTDDPARDVVPSVSQDGKWVYFASNRSGSWQVWRMPADGGEAVQLTRNGGNSPMESLDGRFLFFRFGPHAEVWKMPIKGGESTRAFGPIRGNYNFAVNQDGVCFVGADKEGGLSLRFFELATGTTRKIIDLEKSDYIGVAFAPDGRSALYSQRDKAGSDLMLVENFH
jgi:Tol biopolymer transport system component